MIRGNLKRGWSTDVAVQMNLTKQWKAGIVAQDFISKGIDDLKPTLESGVSWTTDDQKLILRSALRIDQKETHQNRATLSYGGSYQLTDGLIIRGGIANKVSRAGLTVELPFATADIVAFLPNKESNDESSILFGLSLGGGTKKEAIKRKYALFKRHAYAYFNVGSNVVTGASEVSLFGGQRIGTNDLLLLINEATKDPKCSGFVIRLGGLHASLGTLAAVQEIRTELEKAKAKGKHIIVYINQWAMLPEYYLATVADSIVMPELGTISHLGLEIEITKTLGFLQKFGFEENVISTGDHKDAFEGSQPLSKADRELITKLMHDLFEQAIDGIKKRPQIAWPKVKHVFDGRMISANEALDLGLIDKIGYWNTVKESIKEKYASANVTYSSKASIEPITEFVNYPYEKTIFSPFNRIAVIEIDGAIMMGANTSDYLFGGKTTGADYIEGIVQLIEKDIFVKGVLLRINSPGGSMMAADRMYHSISRLKKKGLPIYASMGVTAASGGYYVALIADKIFANPMSLTGSIGVISKYQSKEKMNRLLGFEVERFETGKYMGLFSSNKSLNKDEKRMISKYQLEKYKFFTEKVVKHRGLTDKEVQVVAQGQVFTGKEAKKLKLIDELGDLYDATDALATKAKVLDEPELLYYRPEPRRTLNLFDGSLFRRLIGF